MENGELVDRNQSKNQNLLSVQKPVLMQQSEEFISLDRSVKIPSESIHHEICQNTFTCISLSQIFVCHVLYQESNLSLIRKYFRESLKSVNLIFKALIMVINFVRECCYKTFEDTIVDYLFMRQVARQIIMLLLHFCYNTFTEIINCVKQILRNILFWKSPGIFQYYFASHLDQLSLADIWAVSHRAKLIDLLNQSHFFLVVLGIYIYIKISTLQI